MIKNPPKIKSKLFSSQFLFICVDDQGKYWFGSKLPKNGHFLLSKVPKIINNHNFPKNKKCSKYMIFTQIFNFQPKNTPKGPPDTKDPPLAVGMALAHPGLRLESICPFEACLYRSKQPIFIAFYLFLYFRPNLTHPTTQATVCIGRHITQQLLFAALDIVVYDKMFIFQSGGK